MFQGFMQVNYSIEPSTPRSLSNWSGRNVHQISTQCRRMSSLPAVVKRTAAEKAHLGIRTPSTAFQIPTRTALTERIPIPLIPDALSGPVASFLAAVLISIMTRASHCALQKVRSAVTASRIRTVLQTCATSDSNLLTLPVDAPATRGTALDVQAISFVKTPEKL